MPKVISILLIFTSSRGHTFKVLTLSEIVLIFTLAFGLRGFKACCWSATKYKTLEIDALLCPARIPFVKST